MLKGLHIVCLAGCAWDFTWQPTQEIMLRLACAGNRVLYVEPTGTRNARFADWRRVCGRLLVKVAGARRSEPLPPTLSIYTPLVLPFPHVRAARLINRWIILRAIRAWLGREIGPDVVIWAYFPSPLNVDLVQIAGIGLSVYQIMSSAEALAPHAGVAEANEALLQKCDLVFANSRRLREQALRLNPQAHLFRAGVNLDVFDAGEEVDVRRPAELVDISGPMVGYVGAVHQWVDVDLLAQVAATMTDWQFVMVGPVVREIGPLRGLPNVHWLGQKPHKEIPRYMRHVDVCIVPYILDSYTETSYPAKLNEYLALGKPVVATPLPELVDYNREFGGVLYLAEDAPSFVNALQKALIEKTPEMMNQYRHVARQNSWAILLEEMSGLIEEALRSKFQETGAGRCR